MTHRRKIIKAWKMGKNIQFSTDGRTWLNVETDLEVWKDTIDNHCFHRVCNNPDAFEKVRMKYNA